MFTCLLIHEKKKLRILPPRNSINNKVNYFIVKHPYICICNPIKSLKNKQSFFQNMILAQKVRCYKSLPSKRFALPNRLQIDITDLKAIVLDDTLFF